MAHFIVRGGTIGTQSGLYGPGVHEVEDEALLEELERASEGLSWANVERDYEAPLELTTGEPEEPQPAHPTMGEALVASTEYDLTRKTAVEKMEEQLAPEPGKPTPGFPCGFCDKNLRNEGARIAHVKAKHPDQAEQFLADLRARREAGEHGWGENAEK